MIGLDHSRVNRSYRKILLAPGTVSTVPTSHDAGIAVGLIRINTILDAVAEAADYVVYGVASACGVSSSPTRSASIAIP